MHLTCTKPLFTSLHYMGIPDCPIHVTINQDAGHVPLQVDAAVCAKACTWLPQSSPAGKDFKA